MKGRKPKPTAQITGHRTKAELAQRDTFSADPVASLEPPVKLKGLALSTWKELIVALQRAGVLAQTDLPALALSCQVFGEGQKLYLAMQTEKDPELSAELGNRFLKFSDQFRRFAVEFGLTPSARTRVQGQRAAPVDELDQILNAAAEAAVRNVQ